MRVIIDPSDVEIGDHVDPFLFEQMTEHFKATTISRHGPVHLVEPTIVLEIAFDRIQESKRHKSGYALRFPRVIRFRDADKRPEDATTLQELIGLYQAQPGRSVS